MGFTALAAGNLARAKAVLREVDFGVLGQLKSSHHSQSLPTVAVWVCFWGRHALHRAEPFPEQWQQAEGPAGSGDISVSHRLPQL